MTWFRSFGMLEWIMVIIFIGLCIAYIVRIFRVAQKMDRFSSRVFIKFILRALIFALLLVAFLGPSSGDSKTEIKAIGKDIIMCIDLSKSMDAFDIPPTRIEKIKFETKRIIKAFSSDRMGIIIFSSEAFIQSPLTYDQNALNLFVETMNTGLVPPSGTDFGPPLRLALDKLNDKKNPTLQQKSKIIILISDGEDFGEETEDITNEIKQKNIKLYTLGVGTQEGSQLRAQGGFKKDKEGHTVITQLNPTSLQLLAENTGGEYFEISKNKNDVNRLIDKISNIEGELKDVRYLNVSNNQYHLFLLSALILLIADTIINIKTITL